MTQYEFGGMKIKQNITLTNPSQTQETLGAIKPLNEVSSCQMCYLQNKPKINGEKRLN